jgi:hypothetical protein
MKFLLCFLLFFSVAAFAEPPQDTLTATAPVLNTDGTTITAPLTYNIYQGPTAATLVKVQEGLTSLTTVVTIGVSYGVSACFAETAVENGIESALSNIACNTPHKKKAHKHP